MHYNKFRAFSFYVHASLLAREPGTKSKISERVYPVAGLFVSKRLPGCLPQIKTQRDEKEKRDREDERTRGTKKERTE
jgi:hypothetical protein